MASPQLRHKTNREAVEIGRVDDLAGEPRILGKNGDLVEHGFFVVARRMQLVGPVWI